MRILVFLFFILFMIFQAQAKASSKEILFFDIFSGVPKQENNQLIFTRCSTVKAEYKLHFENPKDQERIYSLLNKNEKFWIKINAAVYTENNKYNLVVKKIDEEHLGVQCNLDDLFDVL